MMEILVLFGIMTLVMVYKVRSFLSMSVWTITLILLIMYLTDYLTDMRYILYSLIILAFLTGLTAILGGKHG